MLKFSKRSGPALLGVLLLLALISPFFVKSVAAQISTSPQGVIRITNARILDGKNEKLAVRVSV